MFSCFRVFVLMVSLFVLLGCETVKPWKRQYLAKPSMQWQMDPQQSRLASHIFFSKEASLGSHSASGGGCGCN